VSLVHAALIAVAFGDVAFAARMAGAVRADQERTFRWLGPAALAGFERAKVGIRGRFGAAHTARVIAGGGLLSTPDATAAAILWLEDHSAVEPPVIPAPPGPITAREQDVLELLASGMTNRQIAEQLGLSVKTVMHHSVSIYRKLGVRGRAEATSAAYRYRLLRAASAHADS
jgi:DNA-binding CsgD family transcriptional regulator